MEEGCGRGFWVILVLNEDNGFAWSQSSSMVSIVRELTPNDPHKDSFLRPAINPQMLVFSFVMYNTRHHSD